MRNAKHFRYVSYTSFFLPKLVGISDSQLVGMSDLFFLVLVFSGTLGF